MHFTLTVNLRPFLAQVILATPPQYLYIRYRRLFMITKQRFVYSKHGYNIESRGHYDTTASLARYETLVGKTLASAVSAPLPPTTG